MTQTGAALIEGEGELVSTHSSAYNPTHYWGNLNEATYEWGYKPS